MEIISLTTNDNVKIAADYYENQNDGIVIISPGWCMTKDSGAFKSIAQMFSEQFDVLSFDFRGHGKSGGWFTFTAKELLDLDAVVQFAETKNYKKIYLAGFSLGAGTSLIYASQNKNINSVIAVSAPADFGKIENQMWKKEAWGETFKKFELSRFLSVRPYPIPLKKIKPTDIIDKVECPVLFLAGEKDPTVHCWHTKELYDKALCKKEFKLFENGCHAEDLYLHFEDEFKQICFNWLNN
ncbi:MAG: alpha/beta fold hydrolase [Candidatus Gastranaerophilaceae bacterium]|nr:alpha/beta fold hydrolase [Candidatus Gastranaerophilaceae bacterium]